MSDAPAPTRAEEGRETGQDDLAARFALEERTALIGDLTDLQACLSVDGRAHSSEIVARVIVALTSAEARAAQAEAEVARLTAENERLHIAFLVLSESGHGGGMYEVRRWFNSGTAKPIPWPGGACFEAWAAEHSIFDCNGAMGFRRRDGAYGGIDDGR